ncbi:MAG: DUF1735 domain-containing protein [Bacteroidota bacterium]
MKKISIILLAFTVVFNSGCMKDKGFDNQEYGIKDPAGSPDGVGFNLLNLSNYVKNVGLVLQDTPQNIDSNSVIMSFIAEAPTTKDIHVSVAINDAIIDDYNTANGTTIVPLDPSLYTIQNATVTIPAGSKNGYVMINIPSTVSIDPSISYGMALQITDVDNGCVVASNMNKVLFLLAIKNIYDGDYVSNGFFYHPTAPRPIVDRVKAAFTNSATSVAIELGDLGGNGYYAVLDVDPISNDITVSPFPNSVTPPVFMFTAGLPDTHPSGNPTGYTPQWANSSECNNVYDPATLSFKVRYGYAGVTGYRVTEEIITRQ